MKLSDMLSEMADHGFTDTTPARLKAFINDAYQDICSREGWPFLRAAKDVALTAGDDTVPTTTDIREVRSFVINSEYLTLTPIEDDELDKVYAGSLSQTGLPQYYYFEGDTTIKVYPTPDSDYTGTIRYVRIPPDLSADADTPIIPERHHRTIVLSALVSAYRMEDDAELSMVFEAQLENRLARMRRDVFIKQTDRPKTVRMINPDSYDYDYYGGW